MPVLRGYGSGRDAIIEAARHWSWFRGRYRSHPARIKERNHLRLSFCRRSARAAIVFRARTSHNCWQLQRTSLVVGAWLLKIAVVWCRLVLHWLNIACPGGRLRCTKLSTYVLLIKPMRIMHAPVQGAVNQQQAITQHTGVRYPRAQQW